MKKVICLVLLMFVMLNSAFALNFNLETKEMYRLGLYGTQSGMTIETSQECIIADGTEIKLSYNRNTSDSFTYYEDEPIVSDGVAVIVSIAKYCDVYGVLGINDYGNIVIPEDIQSPIYDMDSGTLYLLNLRLWQDIEDTGNRIAFVRLKRNKDDMFVVEKIK